MNEWELGSSAAAEEKKGDVSFSFLRSTIFYDFMHFVHTSVQHSNKSPQSVM